jgi:hypothetical protein
MLRIKDIEILEEKEIEFWFWRKNICIKEILEDQWKVSFLI